MSTLVKNVSLKIVKLAVVITLCVATLAPLVANSLIYVGVGRPGYYRYHHGYYGYHSRYYGRSYYRYH